MNGIVIAIGDYWKSKSIEWATEKVRMFGAPRRWIESPELTLITFGEVRSSEDDRTLLLGFHTTPEEFEAAEKAYRDGTIRDCDIRLWDRSMFVAFDKKSRSLFMLKGEMCEESVYHASHGKSFFVASLLKAFTNLDSVDDVHFFEEGTSLERSVSDAQPKITDRKTKWKFTKDPMPYEEAVKQTRETLTTIVRELAEKSPDPPAMCLSGGIDSCVVAMLLAENGTRFTPFHVTFDFDTASETVPGDLIHTRFMAKHLGVTLEEVHVSEKSMRETLDEIVYISETPCVPYLLESVYYLSLVRAIRSAGFARAFHGEGSDLIFGGHKHLTELEDDKEYRKAYFRMMKHNSSQSAGRKHFIHGGVEQVMPYADLRLIKLVAPLPRSYKMLSDRAPGCEKRLLRDAFASKLPREIRERPKGIPWRQNNLRQIFDKDFSSSQEVMGFLKQKFRQLLSPRVLG